MIDIKLEVFHSSTVDYIVLCINIFSRNFNVFSVVSQKKGTVGLLPVDLNYMIDKVLYYY